MGISVVAQDGSASGIIRATAPITNALGSMHGGAIASLFDVVMASAARSVSENVKAVITINLNITFLAPAQSSLTAEAKCLGGGMRVVSVACDMRDEQENLVATALATFRLIADGHP